MAETTSTVLDYPIILTMEDGDYFYAIRGTGADRDKRISGQSLQRSVGDHFIEPTSTGTINLGVYFTNVIVKYNPSGVITSTITNVLPEGKKTLLWNATAFTVSISIEGDSFDLFQNEAIEYISDGTNMKRFDMLIVDKIRAFEDDNTFIDLNADAVKFWTGGVERLQIDNNGLSNSTGDITIDDNAAITGTLDIQGAISNSTGDITIDDNLIVNNKIATNGATGANVTDGGIDIETPSSSGDAFNINNGTNDIATISNAGDLTVYGGISTNQGQPVLLEKVIEIGDWDMDALTQLDISFGDDVKKIRHASGLIRNDADTQRYFFNGYTNLLISVQRLIISTNEIRLNRESGGFFDSTDFDSTSYNRGWLYVKYEK